MSTRGGTTQANGGRERAERVATRKNGAPRAQADAGGVTADQLAASRRTWDTLRAASGDAGKPFYATDVARNARIQAQLKVTGDVRKLAKALDVPVDEVVSAVQLEWAANDNRQFVRAINEAARQEFGLRAAAASGSGQREAMRRYGGAIKGMRQVLRAHYDATQEMLRRAGVTRVLLVRGLADRESAHITAAGTQTAHVASRPLASFTDSIGGAREFSDMYSRGGGGAVIAGWIPADRLLAVGPTGLGDASEHEYVALGGSQAWRTFRWTSGTSPSDEAILRALSGP